MILILRHRFVYTVINFSGKHVKKVYSKMTNDMKITICICILALAIWQVLLLPSMAYFPS